MIEKALQWRLTHHADLTGTLSTRVYPIQEVPQGPTMPYCTYQRISTQRVYTMDGESGFCQARIQTNWYAETYAALRTLVEAARGVLSGYKGTVGNGITFPYTTINAIFIESEGDLPSDPEFGEQDAIQGYYLDLLITFPETPATP